MTDLPELLTYHDFAAVVGQDFGVTGDDTAAFVLEDIQRLPLHDHPGRQREPFAMTFRKAGDNLGQRTYELRNAQLGDLAIFLTPVAREGDDVLYEAVFN